jgi:hypothetical protein
MSSSSSERKKNAKKKIKEENFKNIKSIATECQSLFNLIKQQEDIIKNFQEQERIIKKSIITHQRLKEDLETNRKNLIEVYKVAKEEEEVKDSFANKNKPIIIEENQVKPQANFLTK